MPKESD